MEDFCVTIKVPQVAHQQVKEFLGFLQRIARRHSAVIRFATKKAGEFECAIPRGKNSENVELFLHELMLDRGLYYYVCGVHNRLAVARDVVVPIFREMLEWSFEAISPSLSPSTQS
jgi:hypothetical protein